MAVAALLIAGATAPAVQAAAATMSLDDAQPALTAQGKGWTTSVGLTNLTTGGLAVSARSARPGCALTVGSDELPRFPIPRGQHVKVKVNVPAGCKADDGAFSFTVAATGTASAFTITPTAPEQTPPQWWHLLAFPIALLALGLGGCRLLDRWPPPKAGDNAPAGEGHDLPTGRAPGAKSTPPAATGTTLRPPTTTDKARDKWRTLTLKEKLRAPLPSLPATWSFKDSWATNLTVIGALLTGVFGSADVVKAFLGEDADSAIALATVGSAVATGFVGAGAIVMSTLRNGESQVTAGGLVLAAAVTTAGAFGQLWVGFWSGWELDLGGAQYGLMAALVAAMALLVGYWWRTFTLTLDDGTEVEEPPDYRLPPLTETITAAAMIVNALTGTDDGRAEETQRFLDRLHAEGLTGEPTAIGTAPEDRLPAPRRRRESALF
jgi:hypothetical protein